MQFLLDNAAAVIVLSVVALMVGLVQQRGQQASAEAVVHDMVKAKAEAFLKVLKGDLQNLGAASDPFAEDTSAAYFSCEGAHDGARTTRFHFSTVDDPDPKATDRDPLDVTYRLAPALAPGGQPRTVRIGSAERPLYEVERLAGGAVTGRSGAILTHFLIEVATRDEGFQPVTDACPGNDPDGSDVRAVRVSFVAATAPVGRAAADQAATSGTHVVRYGVTLHPPGMIRF